MAGIYTISALTRQSRNFFRNNGYLPSCEVIADPAIRAYRKNAVSRRFFLSAEDNDFFRMTGNHWHIMNESVWYFMGFRVFVEYFDENVLVDVQYPLEKEHPDREAAIVRLREKLSRLFSVCVVGDNDILDVRQFQCEF